MERSDFYRFFIGGVVREVVDGVVGRLSVRIVIGTLLGDVRRVGGGVGLITVFSGAAEDFEGEVR